MAADLNRFTCRAIIAAILLFSLAFATPLSAQETVYPEALYGTWRFTVEEACGPNTDIITYERVPDTPDDVTFVEVFGWSHNLQTLCSGITASARRDRKSRSPIQRHHATSLSFHQCPQWFAAR